MSPACVSSSTLLRLLWRDRWGLGEEIGLGHILQDLAPAWLLRDLGDSVRWEMGKATVSLTGTSAWPYHFSEGQLWTELQPSEAGALPIESAVRVFRLLGGNWWEIDGDDGEEQQEKLKTADKSQQVWLANCFVNTCEPVFWGSGIFHKGEGKETS